jgi:hypothetical protein
MKMQGNMKVKKHRPWMRGMRQEPTKPDRTQKQDFFGNIRTTPNPPSTLGCITEVRVIHSLCFRHTKMNKILLTWNITVLGTSKICAWYQRKDNPRTLATKARPRNKSWHCFHRTREPQSFFPSLPKRHPRTVIAMFDQFNSIGHIDTIFPWAKQQTMTLADI